MDLSYPIGRFDWKITVTPEARPRLIDEIAVAPALLRQAIDGFDDRQLDTPYRPGGWTVRQVVHHLPDSHMNSYVRFRLALTEDEPTIKAYDEAKWAELHDARTLPPAYSLALLENLPRFPPPRNRLGAPRCQPGVVRLARPASHRSDRRFAPKNGLVSP